MSASATSAELARIVYARLPQRAQKGRTELGRPLTLCEKILLSHLSTPDLPVHGLLERGTSYVDLLPDRVAMQDATAQMALLQFMTAGLEEVAVPATVHCDHLVLAKTGAKLDLRDATDANQEVFDFLQSVSARHGIGFWKPGSGIIHQVVLEHYAFPGGLMVGTDSHTPNAGGLGMLAIGVGGADAVDVLTGFPFNVLAPRVIGVRLTGELSSWASPKDVILEVARRLTVSGGTNAVLEYHGPGADSISASGKATICNMGAEIGATCSVFPYDQNMRDYLCATGRAEVADLADEVAAELRPDDGALYDTLVEIDLSVLGPLVNGPHTPDLAHSVGSALALAAQSNDWPLAISSALIGSCTNSSYEDLSRAASIARQAAAHGVRARCELLITPGSEQIRATIERDGILADLEAVGAIVLANACGPCIGQWERDAAHTSAPNTIVSSFNRNFPARNDGSHHTLAFVTSPETVMALALAGRLDFNPLSDSLVAADGTPFRLEPPTGSVLPALGYDPGVDTFVAPGIAASVEVAIDPASARLQRLEPFAPLEPAALLAMPVLVKAYGKCTTDHISAAGKWLRFRGHLENITQNLFLGAVNAFTREVGTGLDRTDGETRSFPEIARRYHEAGITWCAVGDQNYGEGSSREHAAMEPRFRRAGAIFARSFARIHEANLKKQGLLPLCFADPATYDLIEENDTISVLDAVPTPGQPLRCMINRPDGSTVPFEALHTMSADQVEWFRAGSALNLVRQRLG